MGSNRLKEILVSEGLTQAELVLSSGISTSTIGRVANKKQSVSPTTEGKIIKALNKLSGKLYKVAEVFQDDVKVGDQEKQKTADV